MYLRAAIRAGGVAAAAVVVGMSTASCGSTVTGSALPASSATAVKHIKTPLSALLPDPSRFPKPYDAVVLPPEAVRAAAGDLTGIAAGATVNPATCVPPPQRFGPDQTAIQVGTDDATRATITLELSRADDPLTVRRDQLVRCGKVTVTKSGAVSTVKTRMQPPPPVDADDVIAIQQMVESRGGGQNVRQSMLTLVAQVGDVRITATYMSFDAPSWDVVGGAEQDTAALDELFVATVSRVRKA